MKKKLKKLELGELSTTVELRLRSKKELSLTITIGGQALT